MRAERLAALAADPDAPPFFGRIDRDPRRRHRRDVPHRPPARPRRRSGDPVVIDWRAPIAGRSTGPRRATGMGVRLRRRFGFHAGRLTSYEDEHLDRGESLGLARDLLREEIERPRVGPMRDIVATIQPDQDDLVRAELDHVAVHPGRARHRQDRGRPAPGGVPALHLPRAAAPLRRAGGRAEPRRSCTTSRRCCPTLGEVGIDADHGGRAGRHCARGARSSRPTLATLKGDARMAEVLRRRGQAQSRKPADGHRARSSAPAATGCGAHRLRRYVDDARRALADGLRWSVARERLRTPGRRGRAPAAGGRRRRAHRRRDARGRPLAGGARVRRRGAGRR